MNRGELRSDLAFMLNFTESTADQDFVQARLNKLIQQAYNQELERAKLHGLTRYFQVASGDVTWAASEQRLDVPDAINGKAILDIVDVTDGEPGFRFDVEQNAFWYDHNTLQWRVDGGPGSAMTLRFYYTATAEPLETDEAVPQYIPPQFHYLIIWTAAILGREIADEMAPEAWYQTREDLRLDFYKHTTLGKPLSSTPTLHPNRSGGVLGTVPIDTSGIGDGLLPP